MTCNYLVRGVRELAYALWKTRRTPYCTQGLGSGAGKGGGSGGSIRDAGGKLGERAAAKEEEYFHKENREKLMKLKNKLQQHIAYHKNQIQKHERAVEQMERSVQRIEENKPEEPGNQQGKQGGEQKPGDKA